jgi:hypothetical protein
MKRHKDEFTIEGMSKVFNVSRSGYYQFLHASPSLRKQEEDRLVEKIKIIHKESRQTYGNPRGMTSQ